MRVNLLLILSILVVSMSGTQLLLSTLNFRIPGNVFKLGPYSNGQTFLYTVVQDDFASTLEVRVKRNGQPDSSATVNSFSTANFSGSYTCTADGVYEIKVVTLTNAPVQFTIHYRLTGDVATTWSYRAANNFADKSSAFMSFSQTCTNLWIRTNDSMKFAYIEYFTPNLVPVADIDLGYSLITSASDMSWTNPMANQLFLISLKTNVSDPNNLLDASLLFYCNDPVCGDSIL